MEILRWPAAVPVSRPAPNSIAADAKLDPKLVAAAHQFEASLMSELLKPLNSGDVLGGDGPGGNGDDADSGGGVGDLTSSAEGSGGALMSFGAEALAKALSEKGGMGIARRVLDHFETGEAKMKADADAAETTEKSSGTGRTGAEWNGKSMDGRIRYGTGKHY